MSDVLPMFPLGTVLVPGMVLPLHVFEPRYRALVHDLEDDDRRFGVVLIERGREVGGADQRTHVGTVARVVEAEQFADGRWVLVAVGTERLRVESWLEDAPYPRARVVAWPDEPSAVPPDLLAATAASLERVRGLYRDLGAEDPEPADLADDSTTASYQATALAPLGPWDHHRLLSQPDAHQRLTLLVDLLEEQEQVLRFRRDGAS